jgi:hypothetical protein
MPAILAGQPALSRLGQQVDSALQSHAQVLDRRAQLCVAGEEPAVVEELQAMAQHQFAVCPSRVSRSAPQEIVNTI